ncbi:hypothetical protein CRV08_01995 [Halarcobacter ebronensis]|uniref:Uncharacterized protein n=1 Tax=Halarcobacter ebronensis TaxID=1462615 RepID=A0A4Q0YFZ4_9BACT|nr:hypothetical protein [Halarcobacter ebronensis]RXJ69497.1 hypothetical protein CRV08_01995 [Halarcobacter ebronensis]
MRNRFKNIPFIHDIEDIEPPKELEKINKSTILYIFIIRYILPIIFLVILINSSGNLFLAYSDVWWYGHCWGIILSLFFVMKVKINISNIYKLGIITLTCWIALRFNINISYISIDRFILSLFNHFFLYLIFFWLFIQIFIKRNFTFYKLEQGFWIKSKKPIKLTHKILTWLLVTIALSFATICFIAGLINSTMKYEMAHKMVHKYEKINKSK